MSGRVHVIAVNCLTEFLDLKALTVIHLDAAWDASRFMVNKRMEELIDSHPDVSFGYANIDEHTDHAKVIGLLNVPACSYYRGRTLVATVIGIKQDIPSNISIIRSGGSPDTSNRMSQM